MTINRKIIVSLWFLLLPCISFAKEAPVNQRAKQTENKANRAFIRGDYDKAMKLFSQADKKLAKDADQKLRMKLKMARLYILLQSPYEAITYYDAVRNVSDTMLTVNDVCFYIGALRQSGQNQQAEVVARQYAFLSPYSRNQRYLNTLYSLSNLQRYYGKGDSDYSVKLLEKSSPVQEYWLGKWDGQMFYAVSNSRINDPLKIFYHQTQYYALESDKPMPFKSIPRELQSGPVAFSDDNKLIVTTGISYRPSDRIGDIADGRGMFVTQLYHSTIDSRSNGWHRFEPLFEHQEGYNYAHPAFFNGGKSLVFSSDRPGGYGSMDLYISHWDETAKKWSDPVNMGPVVNTEGDEIFPRIVDDGLYFASNGLEGYGGYDIYRVSFGRNLVLAGSLFHYPYPINSVSNDFGIFFDNDTGYFISDRRGFDGKDDIYTFDASISPLSSESAIGVSDEYSAMAGNLNMIRGLKSSNTQTFEKEMPITPMYRVPDEGEVLLSLYFDFNHSVLDTEAVAALRSLLDNPSLDYVKELYVLGYADEFGSEQYNMRLSQKRAQSAAEFMRNSSVEIPLLFVEGKGKLMLSPSEYAEALNQTKNKGGIPVRQEIRTAVPAYPSFEDRVKLNGKLRRVDIIVKKK